jgi:predicted dehydrogenase
MNNESPKDSGGNIIPGFEAREKELSNNTGEWIPVSDKKIKVGIAGYGLCQFGAGFFYQNHPNVEVVAATDLNPHRCKELAKAVGTLKTYASCEEMIKDKNIEAVFIATDAPSHARLAIMALEYGKHVCSAVPAVFGFDAEEDAEKLFNAVKSSGMKYMMNETSAFHKELYNKRIQYQNGELGKIIYSEGEYYHDKVGILESFNPKNGEIDLNGWRRGLPPMWYSTHSTAYHISVTGERLTEVSCLGMPSIYSEFDPKNNEHKNPFGTEIGLFRTSDGGSSRIAISWDLQNAHGDKGRIYGQIEAKEINKDLRPSLPPNVKGGGHEGSHGQLTNHFIKSILLDEMPIINISEALNMTLSGVIAHKSAMKNGEWMKIPQYEL